MEEKRNKLSKGLGRTDVIALGFGTMVGWSWVVFSATWVTRAGFVGAILAFLLGSVIVLAAGLTYGELTSAFPLSGGEVVYIYRAIGTKMAWAVGWITTLAYVGVSAWEGIAMATAIDALFPIPQIVHCWDVGGYPVYLSWALIGSLCGAVVMVLNLFGTRPAIIFQVMGTAGIIIIGIIFLLGGISFGNIENAGDSFKSLNGFVYVLLMVPAMLIGFDVIPQSAEEMNISRNHTGKMIIVCIVISLVWYLIIIIAAAILAPGEIRLSGDLATAEIMAYGFGDRVFGDLIIFCGILGILTCWNGFFMGATRLVFALGRAKLLPEVFGQLGKKYGTPWAATLVIGIICILAPLLGKNALIWFVDISGICTIFTYCCVAYSFVVLRKKEPELPRPFKLKGGDLLGKMIFILLACYFIIFLLGGITSTHYITEAKIIAIWLILGVILGVYAKKRYGNISRAERELLIFGSKYARPTSKKDEL